MKLPWMWHFMCFDQHQQENFNGSFSQLLFTISLCLVVPLKPRLKQISRIIIYGNLLSCDRRYMYIYSIELLITRSEDEFICYSVWCYLNAFFYNFWIFFYILLSIIDKIFYINFYINDLYVVSSLHTYIHIHMYQL